MGREKQDRQRVTFMVPRELHTKYVLLAEELGVTQTYLYIMAMWQYLEHKDMLNVMKKLTTGDEMSLDEIKSLFARCEE